MNKTREQ